MNMLVENFLKEQQLNNNFEGSIPLDKLHDEFYNYIFRVYLYGYIKKTITLSAMQIKKKNSQINKKEELSLNVIDPNFNDEKINFITNNQNNLLDIIMNDFIVEDSKYNYDEISHDKKILRAINTLTDRQKQIIYMCIVLGETDTLVANKLGITKQGVNKIKFAAINKLRKKLCA